MTGSTALALCVLRLRLNRGYVGFQLAVDVLLPVGYAVIVARLSPAADVQRLVTGTLIFAATLSIMRLPAYILMNERFGVRDLLVAAGVSRADYLTANVVGSLYFALFPLLAVLGASVLVGGVVPTALPYWGVLGVYALFLHGAALVLSGAFRTFGPFVLTVNLLILATAAFCPIFYPAERVPDAIAPLVAILPGSLTSELALASPAALDTVRFLQLSMWASVALLAGYALAPWRVAAGSDA